MQLYKRLHESQINLILNMKEVMELDLCASSNLKVFIIFTIGIVLGLVAVNKIVLIVSEYHFIASHNVFSL